VPRQFIYDLLERGASQERGEPRDAGRRPADLAAPTSARPLTVSQASRAIRRHLEGAFFDLLVEGELSNLSRPASGHWYFTLKDDRSQLKAAMFAGDNRRVRFEVAEGLTVLARGRVTYYDGGGRTQLVVKQLEPSGVGARALALQQLTDRLAKEGLFDEARKRPLPRLPRRVGVVTSATGAAIRDILKVADRRFPQMPLLLAPTRVQGEGAEADIARALRRLDESGLVDVIIIGRGGGSFEDLEVFSREVVVRAVVACATPVVSAVGHEVDTALSDLAADARAATPSVAAAMVVPERATLIQALNIPLRRISALLERRLGVERLRLAALRGALADPTVLVLTRRQDVDGLLRRGQRALSRQVGEARERLERDRRGLNRQAPARRLADAQARLELLALRQRAALQRQADAARARLEGCAATLDALSPLAVLGRGYAICLHDRRAVRDAAALAPGDRVDVRVARGQLEAEVLTTAPAPPGTDPEPDLGRPDSGRERS